MASQICERPFLILFLLAFLVKPVNGIFVTSTDTVPAFVAIRWLNDINSSHASSVLSVLQMLEVA